MSCVRYILNYIRTAVGRMKKSYNILLAILYAVQNVQATEGHDGIVIVINQAINLLQQIVVYKTAHQSQHTVTLALRMDGRYFW